MQRQSASAELARIKAASTRRYSPLLGLTHAPHTGLLKALRQVEGVRKVFVGSGIRHDLVMADEEHGASYMEELDGYHVSGQLKLAPEHSQPAVLKHMRKPGTESLRVQTAL